MKTIIKIYLSLALILSPIYLMNSANAASVGGWTLGGGVAQGASVVYEGTKKVVIDGVDYIKKGTAKITPLASGVAKVLARGAAGYALSVAVEQLLGSVDWVLDPANNQIVYNIPNDLPPGIAGYRFDFAGKTYAEGINPESVCASGMKALFPGNSEYRFALVGNFYECAQKYGSFSIWLTAIPGDVSDEQKTLPLEVVAQKVISNAEAGDTNAQAATTAAAADIVAEAEKDDAKARPIAQQLESSAQTKPADESAAEKANEATGQAKPNTANPEATDLSIEFPAFCGWAPTVCEAAQTVISFPATLTEWWQTANKKADGWALSISDAWNSFRDWFKSDDDLPDDEKPEIQDLPVPELKEDAIRWSAQCPADAQVPINMQGVSSTITFSWSPWCQLLDMIKPAIIASAYIGAAFIVLGLRT